MQRKKPTLIGIVFFIFIIISGAVFTNTTLDYSSDISYVDYYDEATFQDYTNDNYKEFFGSSSAVEDNILLVFLTNEEADGYYTIAWVGDNIKREINEMFGEYTEYGDAMNRYINTDYFGYSLDTDYAAVITYMADSIYKLELEDSFSSPSDKSSLTPSKAVNRTTLDFDESFVNTALEDFTERTGIPCVLLIEYADTVFDIPDSEEVMIIYGDISQHGTDNTVTAVDINKKSSISGIGGVVLILLIGAVAFILIRKKKNSSSVSQTEKCEQKGCDGKVAPDEKPPWEY